MLAICYLLVALWVGHKLTFLFFPEHRQGDGPDSWVRLAASFGVGTLILSWASYFVAWGVYEKWDLKNSLGVADAVVVGVSLLCFFVCLLRRKKKNLLPRLDHPSRGELFFFGAMFAFFMGCFFYVFFASGETLYSGPTVFSDYSPHTAMMRSFSKMNNYPTQYPHFGGEDVRYHFLFQFLVGNMEYLGLRLDIAYNLLSALSLTGFFIVLYGILKRTGHGLLALFFTLVTFLFRSGTAFFQFLWEHYQAGDLLDALKLNSAFIGYTQNENWGFWNFNVYLNQRHLCFGLLIIAVAIYCCLDHVEEGLLPNFLREKKEQVRSFVRRGRDSFGAALAMEKASEGVEASPEGLETTPEGLENSSEGLEPSLLEVAGESVEEADEEGAVETAREALLQEKLLRRQEGFEAILEAGRSAGEDWEEEKIKNYPLEPEMEQAALLQEPLLSLKKNAHLEDLEMALKGGWGRRAGWIRRHWFCLRAWQGKDLAGFFFLGLVVGLTAFWNGASVIGGLLILAGMAVFSDAKLDYLVMAVTAVMTSFLQTKIFIRGETISPSLYIGFLAENKTLPGMLIYLFMITGIGLLGLLILLPALKRVERVLAVAFLVPVVFAFLASLTPDIGVNHKYILIGYAFASLLWGGVLERLFTGRLWKKLLAVLLTLCLTLTGLYDFVIICRANGPHKNLGQSLNGEVTQWLDEHLDTTDLVLSPLYTMSSVTLSGAMLYNGWPYYAWSAGYDTYSRGEKQRIVYTTEDPQQIRDICEEEGITYIVYEDGMQLDGLSCREDVIASIYPKVYEYYYLRIYQVTEEPEPEPDTLPVSEALSQEELVASLVAEMQEAKKDSGEEEEVDFDAVEVENLGEETEGSLGDEISLSDEDR